MAKTITIELPDDVAAFLSEHPSRLDGVVAEARERLRRRDQVVALLREQGFNITEDGMARWRDKLRPLTEEQRARSRRWLQAMQEGRWPDEEFGEG
jgi:hypothetical protein